MAWNEAEEFMTKSLNLCDRVNPDSGLGPELERYCSLIYLVYYNSIDMHKSIGDKHEDIYNVVHQAIQLREPQDNEQREITQNAYIALYNSADEFDENIAASERAFEIFWTTGFKIMDSLLSTSFNNKRYEKLISRVHQENGIWLWIDNKWSHS